LRERQIDDRSRWNLRYENGGHDDSTPSKVLTSLPNRYLLPGKKHAAALDLAGGAGRHAIWIAKRGFQSTLVDVSDRALVIAAQRADDEGVEIDCVQRDLLESGMPDGRWDLILSCLFLHRPLLSQIAAALKPQGQLVMMQPTQTNLERFRRPPARFLLDDGELPGLIEDAGLQVLHYREGWLEDGRHDAILVAENTEPIEAS